MSDADEQRSSADVELEREIRAGRKFTLEEAIGRLAGPGAMKGESPVSRLQQAENEIEAWLRTNLPAGGGLEVVLHRNIRESDRLLESLDQPPLSTLARYCREVLASDYLLKELVRSADVEWGCLMGERPHFEKQGSPPDPTDPYTVESVRKILSELIQRLEVTPSGSK